MGGALRRGACLGLWAGPRGETHAKAHAPSGKAGGCYTYNMYIRYLKYLIAIRPFLAPCKCN